MKRMLRLLVAAVLLLTVAGCGADAPDEPGFTQDDLYLSIDGKSFRCHDNIESVIALLGEDYEYAQARSCDYDGLDKTFRYDVAEFYTWPMEDGDVVNEIYSNSPDASTSRGIATGASREDVLAAYGEDCEDTGWQLIYRLPDQPALCFDLEDGVVSAICLTLQPL